MSNILNLKTGEPFDPFPRLHHRPETSLAVSSSEVSGRARGMLLAAKSFYVGGKKWKPTENAYVDTDGVGYIDTGWSPTSDDAYDADVRMFTNSICGCMKGMYVRYYKWGSDGALYTGAYNFSGGISNKRVKYGVDNLNLKAYILDVVKDIPKASSLVDMPTFTLGGRNRGGSLDYKGITRIWEFVVYRSSVAIIHLVPREIDGVACLWDMVSQSPIYATGGSLTYGISAT